MNKRMPGKRELRKAFKRKLTHALSAVIESRAAVLAGWDATGS
jgi:hypothetical protein